MNMTNTSEQIILDIYKKQKDYFKSGETLDVDFRRKMLKKFLQAMEKWEQRLADALWTDLHKSYEEAYLTEISNRILFIAKSVQYASSGYSELVCTIFIFVII